MKTHLILSLALLLAISSCKNSPSDKEEASLIQTAETAYLYGLPLVLMDITRRQQTNTETVGANAPINQFSLNAHFPDASSKGVIRPNADTFYSIAWLDLSEEPLVLSMPDTDGRYHLLPMLDAFTNVFQSPGTRTTGNEGGIYLVTGPEWEGEVPAGMTEYKSPTNMVWILGRTQVNSKEDGEEVVYPIMKEYKLSPLSHWGGDYTPPAGTIDPTVPVGSPNDIVRAMSVEEYFNYMNEVLSRNKPLPADQPVLASFEKIGVSPGGEFKLSNFSDADQTLLKGLPDLTFDQISLLISSSSLVNGWSNMQDLGSYGTNYALRAAVSYNGLGANLPEDAVYPSCQVDSDGNPFDGANAYTLHFEYGKTPPMNAFWSLTLYDPDGYFVANELDRYAIGDRNVLKENEDKSLTLYIQHDNPGTEKESNWLPAPKGNFNLMLRVYYPKEEMLNGSWVVPPVNKH